MGYLDQELASVEYGKQLPSAIFNGNFEKVSDALDNAYEDVQSRVSVTGEEAMLADLDMNTHRVIRLQDAEEVTDAIPLGQLLDILKVNNPIGQVIHTGGVMDSRYYLKLEEEPQNVSRDTYADLFAAIGVRYGTGNGTTTFTLPSCGGRVILGESSSYPIGLKGGSKERVVELENIPNDVFGLQRFEGNEWEKATGITTTEIEDGYTITEEGESIPWSNMQPYITLYAYIRYKNF